MKILVENYRGIEHAEISCSPIALVVAENAAGKSSVAQAVAAALTGNGLDKGFELSKANAGQLVRRGAKAGRVILRGAGGEARMAFPEAQLQTTGAAPPSSSVYAVGAVSVPGLDRKDRPAALEAYLKSSPSKDDLKRAMEQFRPEAVEALWAEIEAKGWDDTAAAWETRRRDAGRDWERVTGERFGSDKAQNWQPADLADLTMAFSIEDLEGQVAEAKAAVEAAVAMTAIDEAELARMREAAGELGTRQEAVAAAEAAAAKARTEATAAIQARAALPASGLAETPLECPCCHEKLILKNQGFAQRATLEKYEPVDDAILKRRRGELDQAERKLSAANSVVQTQTAALAKAKEALAESQAARDKIAAAGEKKAGAPGLLAQARDALALRESELGLRRKMAEAEGLHRHWVAANLKVQILAPKGLRAQKLGEAVAGFNQAILMPLCEVAGWGAVNLTEDLGIRLGERPYPLLSEGEKWRVRVTLQVAQAGLDGSAMLVIDNLVDLDTAARNGLFRLLQHAGLPALVCSAEIRGVPVPDLAKAGIGGTYKIEDGKTVPFGVLAEAA